MHRSRWFDLLAMTRVLGAVLAVMLLGAHSVSDYDGWLVVATVVWTSVSLSAFGASTRLQRSPLAWLVDAGVALGLVWLSTDWRSPFYIFALTTLILPATELPFRRSVGWGIGFMLSYLGVAIATERLAGTFERAVRLEIIATHLMTPIVIVLALGYAADVLRRLATERRRTERLAVEAERQRIAWELHDSAKQRLHAAHLVLSALDGRVKDGNREVVDHAMAELRAATADMDTSVAELRAPLDGRPLDLLLRERARELAPASPARIEVHGGLPELPPLVATHAYRIAAEALTNAVRHSGATTIDVELRADSDHASLVVRDDGAGMPETPRPGSHGLPSMRNRAETIGADIEMTRGPDGTGTEVRLEIPLHRNTEVPG